MVKRQEIRADELQSKLCSAELGQTATLEDVTILLTSWGKKFRFEIHEDTLDINNGGTIDEYLIKSQHFSLTMKPSLFNNTVSTDSQRLNLTDIDLGYDLFLTCKRILY